MRPYNRKLRSQKGSLFTVLLPFLLISCMGVAAFAVDFAHGVLLRTQLQNACDAAALSAAQDLIQLSAAPTEEQIAKAQANATAIANLNVADNDPINIAPIKVTYNPSSSASVPAYGVEVTATQNLNSFFAVLFGHGIAPIKASAKAGIFSQGAANFANMAHVTCPLAVTIDVNANNDMLSAPNSALQYVKKGQGFKIETYGKTGGGTANGAWVALEQGNMATPVVPTSSTLNTASQWASKSGNAGIVVAADSTTQSFLGSAGGAPSSAGGSVSLAGGDDGGDDDDDGGCAAGCSAPSNPWVSWIASQIAGSSSGQTLTFPLLSDPTGDSDPASLKPGRQLQVIGTVTFAITKTSSGPSPNLSQADSLYGTLVSAQPIDANAASAFSGFFNQFTSGGLHSGTPSIRLYN